MQRAVNPQTGEVLFLVDNQWVKPTQRAFNPETGQNAYLVNNEWQTMPMPSKEGAKPTDRTMGEAIVTDPLAALLSGAGTAMGSPGQLKQLLTGEKPAEEKPKGTIESLAQSLLPFGVDISKIPEKVLEKLTPSAPSVEGVTSAALSPFQGIQPVGEELKAFGEKQKSAGLKAAEKGREKAIQEAEGFLPEVGAAVGQTIKNPALLSSFIFEQIPNFAGTLGGGFLSKEAAKAFFKDATEKTLGKIGVGGAVATGGAMQAGDIGSETYQTIYDRLVKEGTPQDEAHQIALEKGRMAAAQAGAISVASSFIPGGKALERRFLTEAGKKAGFPGFIPGVGNIIGEATQEGVEEGGGKLVSNIQAAQVFPDIDVMKGVGAATGLGALGGGMFGGISNVPSALSRTAPTEPAPSGAPPTAGAPVTPPAAPAVPLEAQLEETPANVRLLELEKALKEVDLAFQNPDLTADDFRNLNNLAGQIRSQIAQIQSGEEGVTPVTPTPEAAQPAPVEVAPVEAPAPAPIETPAVPEAAKPVEVPAVEPVVAPQSEQAYRMKYAVEAIDKGETKLTARNVNPLAKELGIKPGATPEETLANVKESLGIQPAPESVAPKATEVVEEPPETVDSTNPENIKKATAITAKFQNNEDVSREESDFRLAVMRDVMSKEEKLKSPPISKKSVIPIASIEVAPFNGGYVSSFSYNEFTKGLGIGTPLDINTIYPTRQEAIDAVAKEVRDRAEKDGNKVALKWLDTVATPVAPKKTQAEINKARQAEKKAAAAKAKEPLDTSAVPDADKIRKKNGYVIYKRKSDMDYWRVQSIENKLANRIGEGDSAHSDLGTAEDKIYNNINEEESKPQAEAKPKIEELVSPEVAAAMKDIEFQKRLIKANKEKALTEAQFSKVFNLQQAGKTAEADDQLTKILAKNEKKVKSKEEPIEIAKIEPVKEVEGQVSKEYQAALNKSRKATKAFQASQDAYRKRLINDEEFLAARKRYDDAMAEYDKAFVKEQAKPVAKPEPKPKKAKPVTDEDQLIQDAVMYAKAAERTGLDEEAIRNRVENAKIKEPIEYIIQLKNSVENLKKQAKDYVVRKASDDYNDQIGQRPSKDSQIVDAIKGGALDISGKDYAEAFYKIFNIKAEAIKTKAAGTPVDKQIVKFESNVFSTADVKPEVYKEAAEKFLQSPLTSPMPKQNQAKLNTEGLSDIKPLPIEKKSYPKATDFKSQIKSLDAIAAPEGETRYYLKGVHLDDKNNRMVVTDGYRMAIVKSPDFKGMPKFTGEGDKILGRDGKYMEGKFPPVDKVLEANKVTKQTSINATDLADYARGVKKAWRYVSGDKYSAMRMNIDGKTMGFNSEYLEDMANLFKSFGYDTFNAGISKNQALVATSPDGKVTQVVMGMKDASPLFAEYVPSKKAEKKVTKTEPTEGTFYNNFEPDFTEEDFDHSVDDVRKEKIQEQAVNSRRITAAVKKIADMGSDLKTQYELNRAINAKKALADEIDAMKQPKTLPEDIMARAAKERAEFQRTGGLDGLSPEAYAVLEALYQKNPNILNGLKLSVRRTERRGVTGSFDPLQRIVTVYKKGISAIFGGAGEKQAKTMRHEITHSLEQMMDSEARKVLVNAWANSLQKAIKKYEGDEVYQDYFNAVLDFIEKPSEATYRKATDLMPEYKMYQYISPSEFWAVNAEPLLDAQLGGAWARFTKAVKGLWEAIKSVFGFDNRYAIHREFNRIMAGDQQRITKSMLVDYLDQTGVSKKFINNIEEERNLIEDLNLPEVPEHEERSMKDMAVAGYRKMQDWGKEFGDNPGKTATKSLIAASDKVTQFRIDNIFFGAGVEKRDQQRYNGQIRAADGLMAASIAIKNAIHSAHIATRVITQGGLELSKQFGQFVAVKSENSMGNVVKLQYKLKKKLGSKTALQIINAYFIAKRSRSIQNEFLNASANLEQAMDSGDFAQIAEAQSDYNSIKTAYGKIPRYFRQLNEDGKPEYETIYDDNGKAVDRIPILNDDAIDRAIGMEKLHPELKEMMKNWTAVNQNMLDMLALSGRLSKKAADKLKAIKDYVPWYRIMDDQEDIHDGKLMSNYPGGPKRFKAGETDRDIDNVVESMIHNVVMMTRSATKNYAINRVIAEYGQRYEEGPKKGKLMVFPSEGKDAQGTRIASFIGGRRVVTNIPDDLVADGVLGLIAAPFTFPLQNVLSAAANGFRRAITFTPWFQLKQAFIDAPTAAWVSGVRSPFKLWGACFEGFVRALKVSDEDPIVQILKNAGIGGYQSFHRSARKEREIELGLLERSNYATFLSAIDHVGDASDLSQRVAVYKRVLAESGDPGLALLQASDIIDFQKHGKGRLAQAMRTTVTFMQAYATQIDALAQASIGGNLKGKTRAEARKQFRNTGLLLATTTLLYAMMAGADDDYWELDDQTRLRNLYIPGSKKATGHHILIPMSTSASFFFKVIPEQLYAKVVSEGTKNEMDARRVWKALGTAAIDSLLGPNPVPTGAKPVIEIALNRNFYTGGNVVPKGLEGLEAAQQYNASTSELGHAVSKLTGGVLNPIQADHLMRGIGGSVATLSMYFSNLAFGENRPEPDLRQNPVIGNLVAPEVSRKNEELFYDLREAASEKYRTYQSLLDDEKFDEADKYYDKNEKLIVAYDYVSKTDADLKQINKEIRRLGKSVDKDLTPQIRTQEINELKRTKVDILEDITEFRKEAGF